MCKNTLTFIPVHLCLFVRHYSKRKTPDSKDSDFKCHVLLRSYLELPSHVIRTDVERRAKCPCWCSFSSASCKVRSYVHMVFYSNIFVIPSRLTGSLTLRAKCTPGDAARVSASDACRVHYRLTRSECTIDGLVTSVLWTDS